MENFNVLVKFVSYSHLPSHIMNKPHYQQFWPSSVRTALVITRQQYNYCRDFPALLLMISWAQTEGNILTRGFLFSSVVDQFPENDIYCWDSSAPVLPVMTRSRNVKVKATERLKSQSGETTHWYLGHPSPPAFLANNLQKLSSTRLNFRHLS